MVGCPGASQTSAVRGWHDGSTKRSWLTSIRARSLHRGGALIWISRLVPGHSGRIAAIVWVAGYSYLVISARPDSARLGAEEAPAGSPP